MNQNQISDGYFRLKNLMLSKGLIKGFFLVSTLIFLFPIISLSQSNSEHGIQWARGLSWDEIKQKAKLDNKYIFIDCYATWCTPCKQMDQKVYPNDTVGNYLNEKFISVRVQLDTTTNDNEEIKRWYRTATYLRNAYSIYAMPTFLFFSPNGEIVHKAIGAFDVAKFVSLAMAAIDTNKQYYTLLKNYQLGKLGYEQMPGLAKDAKQMKDDKFAYEIASKYTHGYLDKLDESSFCSKENQDFMQEFRKILNSTDREFIMCLNKPQKIDAVTYSGCSKNMADYVISKEEIEPYVKTAVAEKSRINWDMIYSNINHKYGLEYARDNILPAKANFCFEAKDWQNFTSALIQFVEEVKITKLNGPGGAAYLNDRAWDIFSYSDKKGELKKALIWSIKALEYKSYLDSGLLARFLDTKANILYKIGKRHEALTIEEEAYILDKNNPDIQKALIKMKNQQPTW